MLFRSFTGWVNWNGYAVDHKGVDFAVYLNSFGECVLGLPPRIPIHAIQDGVVVSIERKRVMERVVDPYDHYFDTVIVAHNKYDGDKEKPNLLAVYAHVDPKVREGDFIRKGQRIARLHADLSPFNAGRLVHLHFGLSTYDEQFNFENPEPFFLGINELIAQPQREPQFQILQLEQITDVRLANFSTLYYGYADIERGVRNREFSAPRPTYSLRRRIKELL